MTVGSQRRFGHQPVQDLILRDGRTIRGTVRGLKSDHAHALLAIAGRVPPSTHLRAELSAKFGVPIELLFTKAALDAEYRPQHRPSVVYPA